jgi:hypothetical protein
MRPDSQKLCRDLWRYSVILSQTTDVRASEVLRELIIETEERVFALEEMAERAAAPISTKTPARGTR